ncbi:MAG: hypothetical protein N3G22_03920, partial [Candidatus Micrarchaeota archaeon]|nr:hypothetical protein [Candidatus Micrarchaeota archaeon]
EFFVPPLQANERTPHKMDIICHSPGTVVLNITADATNNITESNETDNELLVPIRCGQKLPDYIISHLSVDNNNPAVGESFSVVFTTMNNGTLDASNYSLTVASFPGNPGSKFSISPLGVGNTSTFGNKFVCSIPGTHLLNVTADATNNITESNETNNMRQLAITCGNMKPDYVVSLSAPPRAPLNAQFNVSVNITNIGLANSAVGTEAALYPASSPAATQNERWTVPALAVGQSNITRRGINCDWAGAREYRAVADYLNSVDEINETNNEARFTTECINKPDYALQVTAPSTVRTYTDFSVKINLTNFGVPALQNDFSITNASFQGQVYSKAHLPLGSFESDVWEWIFTCTQPGVSTLVVQTLPPAISGDYDPSNNLVSLAINCTLPDAPDYVSGCTAPNIVPVGTPFLASYYTRNIGGKEGSTSTKTNVYFGADNSLRSKEVPPLLPGQETSFTETFTCSKEGEWEITVMSDANNDITDEYDEGNNQFSCPVSCGFVDYVPNPTVPGTITLGVPFSIDAKVENRGTVSGLSDTITKVEAGGEELEDIYVPPLEPGGSYGEERTYTCNTPGPTTIKITADFEQTSGEVEDATYNNEWALADAICTAADYKVVAPQTVDAYAGLPFFVDVNTTNIGLANGTGTSKTRYSFTAGGAGSWSVPPLAPGEKHTHRLELECQQPGVFVLNLGADSDNEIKESDENNNNFAVTVYCSRQPAHALVCSSSQFSSTLTLAAMGAIAMSIIVALAYMLGQSIGNARLLNWAKTEAFQLLASITVAAFIIWVLLTLCNMRIGEVSDWLGLNLPPIYAAAKTHNLFNGSMIYLENLGGATHTNLASLRYNLAAYEIRTSYQQYICDPLCKLTLASQIISIFGGESVYLAITNNLLSVGTIAHLTVLFEYFLLVYIVKGLFIEFLPLAIVIRSVPFMRQLGGALIGIFVALYILYPAMLVANAFITPALAQYGAGVQVIDRGTGCAGVQVFGNTISCVPGLKESEIEKAAGVSEGAMQSIAPSDIIDSIKFSSLVFIAAVFLPAMNFVVIVAFARDLTRFLGEEADISRLGQMI